MAPRATHLRPVPTAPQPPKITGAGPDDGLVSRAIAGDADAWAQLYCQSYPTLFRQLRYLTGEDALAEELAQETFARAIASAKRYDPRRPFGAWIYGIGLNVVRKHWRKSHSTNRAHARLRVVADVIAGPERGSPHHDHVQRQRSRLLYELLEELPDRWREAFILREIEGLSVEETAQRLDISPKNVTVRAARARSRIREEIIRRGWGAVPGGER